MSIEFVRRKAGQLLGRGTSAVRFKPDAMAEIAKALTSDDVRNLIKNGSVIALPEKHNLSRYAKILKKKRQEGRRRGVGRRKGTKKARKGISWEKKVRSQRRLLKELKAMDKLENKDFTHFYMLIKGNAFADKASLLLHIKEQGIKITDEEIAKINEKIKSEYK